MTIQQRPTLYIDGVWCSSSEGSTRPTINPYDASVLTEVDEASVADAERAIASAKHYFTTSDWPSRPYVERCAFLSRMVKLLQKHKSELARIETLDTGKTLGESEIDIDDETLERIRGLGDPTDQTDVAEVYRPLTQLIHLYCMHTGSLFEASNTYLQLQDHQMRRTPFVIGVAGSVAVGKSTTARLLQELLGRSPRRPKVDLVPTDGFLYPNAVLEEHGILDRKGFPESYDRKALLKFVVDVKSGAPEVVAPVYSHVEYDIVAARIAALSASSSMPCQCCLRWREAFMVGDIPCRVCSYLWIALSAASFGA